MQFDPNRRDFVALLAGAAAWPLAARAQQPGSMRRVGILMSQAADNAEAQRRVAIFMQELGQLGWSIGRNLQIEIRYGAGNHDLYRRYAKELVAFAPDAILANGSGPVVPLQQESRSVPIVFISVADPVGAGLVASLARPGGSTTGFSNYEYGIAGKWLELLKEIAPGLKRVAVIRDPAQASGSGQFGAIQSVAPTFGVEAMPIGVRNAEEIQHDIGNFARTPNGSLVLTSTATVGVHRKLIIQLAAKYRLPATYPFRYYVSDGGLISYSPDQYDQVRRAAGYVDRILKGEKPADLPVQAPVKYELAINLKTAKALGLDMPATVLARADEVIE